jgi:D-arabinose 1-dehydrogenase-like Zn-dependent alcohol dehydrogenase
LIGKGISVHGWPSGHARDCEEAIEFAQTHDVRCMVEKFKFSDVKAAVDKMINNEVRFRSVLVMDQ